MSAEIETRGVCPWCESQELKTEKKKPHYADWGCGSYQRGDEPVQSIHCELNVMEAQRDELLAACRLTVADWDDADIEKYDEEKWHSFVGVEGLRKAIVKAEKQGNTK